MTLSLTQSVTAVGVGIQASFLAIGGTFPYTYEVLTGGAGGVIDSDTGVYIAPLTVDPNDLQLQFDTIQVTDGTAATATAQIAIGTPLILFCEVIQHEMGLANGRVYLWDQKIMQPKDSDLYIAVSVPRCRPFANSTETVSGVGLDAVQSVNMQATVDIDIISRGPAARDRKEEVVLAFNSIYAQQQQEINSFYIAKLPPNSGFINLSNVDGAAIPYRYRISVNLQYFVSKTKPAQYFDNYQGPNVYTNP